MVPSHGLHAFTLTIFYLKENIVQCNWLYGGVRFVTEMPHLLIGKIDRQHFKRLVKDKLLTAETVDY